MATKSLLLLGNVTVGHPTNRVTASTDDSNSDWRLHARSL